MGLQTAPAYISLTGFNHPAELDRNIIEKISGNRTGAWRVGDFAVTPTGVAQQVSVAGGAATLVGVENATQGAYFAWSDAAETRTFGVPSGSARIDTLLLRVKDSQYGTIPGSPAAYWDIVAGVPSGSPVARVDADFNSGGSFYVPGAWWRVADVRINPGDTTIPGGQITHNLRYIRAAGRVICTSATRPADPVIGDKVYETDTKYSREWDGTAWILKHPYVQNITLSSTTGSITFNVPSNFRSVYITWRARSSQAAITDALMMRFNGDNGANYSYTMTQVNNGAVVGTASVGASTNIQVGVMVAASGAANNFATGVVELAGWDLSPNMNAVFRSDLWESGLNSYYHHGGGLHYAAGTNASITLVPNLASFVSGSRFQCIAYE
jgi:hypothetical protein